MATIDEVFPVLSDIVSAAAEQRGYAARPLSATDGFGGRERTWQRGEDRVRLAWDGREQWVTFERRTSADAVPRLEWTGTLSERYSGQNISDSDLNRLRDALEAVLRSAWSERPNS